MTEHPNRNSESAGTLIREATSSITTLVRAEIDLARAEIDRNLRKAGVAVGMIVAGVVVALAALDVLSAAVVVTLTDRGLQAGWAALIVGVVLGLLAALLTMRGLSKQKLSSLAPTRTAENVKRDTQAMKGDDHAQ